MAFLYPKFLWALWALAIPVIIHLFNFRRYKTVYFSNTRFLKEITESTKKTRQLLHWLVLLSRLLFITFLVFAFAQPFISSNEKTQKPNRAISIYLDNSFSMRAKGEETDLLTTAKEAAKKLLNSYDESTHFQIITNDIAGKHQRFLSKENAINEVDAVQIGPAPNNFQLVYNQQKELLKGQINTEKEIYFFSDFQNNQELPILDSSIHNNFVKMQSVENQNVYIDTAWLNAPVNFKDQNNQLIVKLVNESNTDLNAYRLALNLNGTLKAMNNINLPKNSFAYDSLSFSNTATGLVNLELSIDDYPIDFDNHYFISYPVYDAIKVLVIEEATVNPFLRALFSSQPLYQVQYQKASMLTSTSFDGLDLVVMNALPQISNSLSGKLADYANNGGNIILFPDEKMNLTSYQNFLTQAGARYFTQWNADKRETSQLNVHENLFEDIFERIQANIKLPTATGSFDRSKNLNALETDLLNFKDGQSFVSKLEWGKGNMYIFSTPLQEKNTDLGYHGLFAPLIFRMASLGNKQLSFDATINADTRIFMEGLNPLNDNVYKVKAGEVEFIPTQIPRNTGLLFQLKNEAKNAGFYAVLNPDDKQVAGFALNYSRKESVMKFFDNEEIKQHYTANEMNLLQGDITNMVNHINQSKSGYSLWKLCLIFALLFLLVEILLIRLWRK